MKPTFHWSVEQNHLRPRWLAVLDYQQRNISRIQPVPVATFARWRSRAASVAHLRNQKTRPHVHIYFSMVWFVFNHHYHSRLPLRYILCAVCFHTTSKKHLKYVRLWNRPEKYRKKYQREWNFFLTSLLDTDWISIRGKSFYFHCIDGKKKRNYKMEKKKIKEDVCDVKFIGSRYVIIIRYYYILIRWYKF